MAHNPRLIGSSVRLLRQAGEGTAASYAPVKTICMIIKHIHRIIIINKYVYVNWGRIHTKHVEHANLKKKKY